MKLEMWDSDAEITSRRQEYEVGKNYPVKIKIAGMLFSGNADIRWVSFVKETNEYVHSLEIKVKGEGSM